jgi:hypothetical protein
VDLKEVGLSNAALELAHRLNERGALDISDCAILVASHMRGLGSITCSSQLHARRSWLAKA